MCIYIFFSWIYAIMLNFRQMDLRKKHPDVIPVGTPIDIPEGSTVGVADIRKMFTEEDVAYAHIGSQGAECGIIRAQNKQGDCCHVL